MSRHLVESLPIAGLLRSALALALVAVAFVAWSTPSVHAQATRTWVSGVGDDANPCSRTAPCKTFAGAISKTATGGEINCLDPGGFGAVTITKSITIDCTGTFGSILAAGFNGVNVNDSATGTPGTIVVHLRGLSINGAGTGLIGINFFSGAVLTVDASTILGFNAGSGRGIFAPARNVGGSFMQLSVMNTTVKNNGIGISGGGGIVLGNVSPTPANAGVIRATLDNVNLTRNNIGLRVSPNTESSVKSSSIDSNISFNLVGFSPGGGAPSLVNVDDTAFVESIAGTGVHAEGTGTIIRLSRTIISGNNIGVATLNGGQVLSAGNNFNQGNITSNGVFSGPAPLS